MSMLFRVVEKLISNDRRSFTLEGGIWHERLEGAREAAQRIAPTTLAHRLFIVNSLGIGKGKEAVLEEIELQPLIDRMANVHRLCLQARNPERLAAELEAQAVLPAWRQRLPAASPLT